MKQLCAALLLAATIPAFAASPTDQGKPGEAIRKAPEFTLTDASGKETLLSSYRGKVVVIAFVYTTCPHCQAFSMVLEKLYKELGPRGFQPIDVAWNENAKVLIDGFAHQYGVTFPMYWSSYDPIMSYMKFSVMDRPVVPLEVVIDRKFNIRAQSPPQGDSNLQDETKLRALIEELLKEPAGGAKK
jgi:peroxiredoxin